MPWKRVSTLVVTLAVLAACGGNQPLPPVVPDDGSGMAASDDFDSVPAPGESDAFGFDDPASIPELSPIPAASVLPSASPSAVASAGFVFRGVVTNAADKPLAGARVSIGAQTMMADEKGEFEFKGITDAQLSVEVSKSGYDAIINYVITFSNTAPTVDKIFTLVPLTASPLPSASPVPSVSPLPPAVKTGLVYQGKWDKLKFASVDAMVVSGGQIYVLGVRDRFLVDRKAVVVMDVRSGTVLREITGGLFNGLPKAAETLDIIDNRVVVSDGTSRWTFDSQGQFKGKSTGGSFERLTEVRDAINGITYTLKTGHKLEVKLDGQAAILVDLRDVGFGRVLGLDEDGLLLILDERTPAVHQYRFNK